MMDPTGELLDVVDELPDGAFRAFCRWMLREAAPALRGDWLQAMGWRQINAVAELSLATEDYGPEAEATIAARLGPLQAYLTFEAASDDLAIGLDVPERDAPRALAYRVLRAFNAAMRAAFSGDAAGGRAALESLRPLCESLRAFDYRTFPERHRAFAAAWSAERAGELERDTVWLLLKANLEAALRVHAGVEGNPLARLVREGFRRRYEAVDRTLSGEPSGIAESVDAAAGSIMVSPVLALYLLAWQRLAPEVALREEDLAGALHQAAVLTRLANDLGPVMQLDEERVAALARDLEASPQPRLREALADGLPAWAPAFTRVHKDLRHGEYNLLLHGLTHQPTAAAWGPFIARLRELTATARAAEARLAQELRALERKLETPAPGLIIRRFVDFHLRMYSRPHTRVDGEYAV